MNLITKMLMENEAEISGYINDFGTRNQTQGLEIRIVNIEDIPTKKELLGEVHEKFYVSELEWMLLNYWKVNGVISIALDKYRNITLWNGSGELGFEMFYQNWQKEKIFQFLEEEKEYKLDDLISRCALIEG